MPDNAAPAFALFSSERELVRLEDHLDRIVVLEWLNADCAASRYCSPAMRDIAAEYAKQGVVWFGIDSTHFQTPQVVEAYRRERKLPYPILLDPDGKIGRAYGANTTPHMFIIQKGVIVYRGRFDNGSPRRSGRKNYVVDTLESLGKNRRVAAPSTTPYGCAVRYHSE